MVNTSTRQRWGWFSWFTFSRFSRSTWHEVVVLDDLSRGEESQINAGARLVHGDVRLFQDWENACLDFEPK